MDIPYRDWQFWATTVVFLSAVLWLLRGVLPVPYLQAKRRRRKRTTRVTLTVGGKAAK